MLRGMSLENGVSAAIRKALPRRVRYAGHRYRFTS
jgi:hypothetical protein